MFIKKGYFKKSDPKTWPCQKRELSLYCGFILVMYNTCLNFFFQGTASDSVSKFVLETSSLSERSTLLCNNIFTQSEELALTRDIIILNADNQTKLNERLSLGDFEDLVNECLGNLSSRSTFDTLARARENKKFLNKHKLRHSRVNIMNVGAQKVHASAYNTAHLYYQKGSFGKENMLLKNWEAQCIFLRKMWETVKQKHLLPSSPILDFEERDPSPMGSPSPDRGPSPDREPSPERGPSPSSSRSPSPLRSKKLTSSMVYSESDSEDEYSSTKVRGTEKSEKTPISVDKKKSSKNKDELKSKLHKKRPVGEDERRKHQSKKDVEIRRPKEPRRISDPNRFKIPKVGRSNEGPQSMKSILEEGLRKANSIPNNRQSKYQDFRKEQRLKEMRKRDNPIDIKKVTF